MLGVAPSILYRTRNALQKGEIAAVGYRQEIGAGKLNKVVRPPPFSPDPIVLVSSKYLRSWRQIEDSIDELMP